MEGASAMRELGLFAVVGQRAMYECFSCEPENTSRAGPFSVESSHPKEGQVGAVNTKVAHLREHLQQTDEGSSCLGKAAGHVEHVTICPPAPPIA